MGLISAPNEELERDLTAFFLIAIVVTVAVFLFLVFLLSVGMWTMDYTQNPFNWLRITLAQYIPFIGLNKLLFGFQLTGNHIVAILKEQGFYYFSLGSNAAMLAIAMSLGIYKAKGSTEPLPRDKYIDGPRYFSDPQEAVTEFLKFEPCEAVKK